MSTMTKRTKRVQVGRNSTSVHGYWDGSASAPEQGDRFQGMQPMSWRTPTSVQRIWSSLTCTE